MRRFLTILTAVVLVSGCTTIEVRRMGENQYSARVSSWFSGDRSFENMAITRTGDGDFSFDMSGAVSETRGTRQAIDSLSRLLQIGAAAFRGGSPPEIPSPESGESGESGEDEESP